MVVFTVLIASSFIFIRRTLALHKLIEGQWVAFLWNWIALWKYARLRPKGRLQLHDLYSDELEHANAVPFPEEDNYARPKQNQSELLFIQACNVGQGSSIEVHFNRTPLAQSEREVGDFEPLKEKVELRLRLQDGTNGGDTYRIEREGIVESVGHEYRAFGFAFEPLQANKLGRIKFRGYLQRESDGRLCYVKMRLLCTSFTTVIDHKFVQSRCFMNREMIAADNPNSDIASMLDDRQEQWTHVRGTVQYESEQPKVLHFCGTIGRRLFESVTQIKQVSNLFAFTKNGTGFILGLVELSSGKTYRYGMANFRVEKFLSFKTLNLTTNALRRFFDDEEKNTEMNFEVTFENDRTFQIDVLQNKKILFRNDDGTDEGMFFTKQFSQMAPSKRIGQVISKEYSLQTTELVLTLDQPLAKLVQLSGGKGASLAQLMILSGQSDRFTVPKAIVVSTQAYDTQIKNMQQEFNDKLEELQQVAYREEGFELEKLKKSCEEMQRWFGQQTLCAEIRARIQEKLSYLTDNENAMFAVRSSGATEDSEEMSTAGQMKTLLGVRSIDNLCQAVMSCWASQFGFVAIEYKRGYGQELNAPMAVVIQTMVECQSAGVVFTAHPTTGDERLMTITSNFGLGESVVSAAADPENFDVEIDVSQQPRKVLKIADRKLGSKTIVTRVQNQESSIENVMNEEYSAPQTDKASLEDSQVLEIADVCLRIQEYYGTARDIEWGVIDSQLFIFQSRPITNLDSGFTDWELMHETDTPHCSETEVYSRSHWGENFPGSATILAASFFQSPGFMSRGMVKQRLLQVKDFNPFLPGMAFVCQQLMFNLRYGMFGTMFRDYPKSKIAVSQVWAFFGRHITDAKTLAAFADNDKRFAQYDNVFKTILKPIFLIYVLFIGPRALPKIEKKIFSNGVNSVLNAVRRVQLKNKYRLMASISAKRFVDMHIHGICSMSSGMKSFILQQVLSSTENDVAKQDFNHLMGHCNDVVSAEVPNLLKKIAKLIENKAHFMTLDDRTALEQLKNGSAGEDAKLAFEDLLEKHGHRGYREFDPYYKPWGWDPLPCVQVVLSLLKGGAKLEPRDEVPMGEIVAQIKSPLSWWRRALIENVLLDWCRTGAGMRERTKSCLIRLGHENRVAIWHIAQELVRNGQLPQVELFFFLKLNEIDRLLSGERDAMIVKKAKQRFRIYPTLNKFKFDEFQNGFYMEPKQHNERIVIQSGAVKLSGTPVTVGAIKARICVAETIEEACNIQSGDILVTYSTDIGWSPYFPLLSGIVTEIGGTISHGAVIAREFGIPCLIAVDNACQRFQTGDYAFLDTNSGTIVKVEA